MAERVEPAVLDVSDLPTVVFGIRSVTWWGIIGMMAIEGTVFVLMIASYFYLRTRTVEWPPHRDPPALFWGTLNLVIFLVSTIPNEWYRRRARKGDLSGRADRPCHAVLIRYRQLVVRYFELFHLNTDWSIDAYGSAVWTLIGLHVVHLQQILSTPSCSLFCSSRRWWKASASWMPRERRLLVFCRSLVDSDLPCHLLGAEVVACVKLPGMHIPRLLTGARTRCFGLAFFKPCCRINQHDRGLLSCTLGMSNKWKRMGFIVSAVDLCLCIVALGTALSVYRQIQGQDESAPVVGRRHFMAQTGILFAVLGILVVAAGTIALFTVHPCD